MSTMKTSFIQIHPSDNVIVAVLPFQTGDTFHVSGQEIRVAEDIPAGHKIAIRDLKTNEHVIKYGYPIGHASRPISQGQWVNETNLQTNLDGLLDYTYHPHLTEVSAQSSGQTFRGYLRKNGEVGIRNEIWVIPTVGCVNGVANQLVEKLRQETGAQGVDAIVAFPHNYGCSQLGDDHANTKRILADMVKHPNAGGVLVIGLGCENNQVKDFKKLVGEVDEERVKFMVCQEVADEMEHGMNLLRGIYRKAIADQRTETPISQLRIGLKCGGSDGFSGITANPLLGVFSDYLIANGGTTVLTEVPEMFGAETILMNRCANRTLFEKTVSLINDFKDYFIANHQPIYENPSPGNKAGGISTLEEKSLGCTQKCGSSIVRDVLRYGERIQTSGLNLLSAPGNDLVASTALAASGCQLVLFTTGRGTPFGTFVPTMKIATNNTLANLKSHWIDFNAGTLLDGETMEELAQRFIQYLLEVANGDPVQNERKGYREIAIFKTGVTL